MPVSIGLQRNFEEKAWWELHKDDVCYFEQILDAVSNKTAAVRYLPPISQTIQVKRTRYAKHSWRIKAKLIKDVLLWTPADGHTSIGRP